MLQQEQDDDQWVTEDEVNQDYDDYDNEEEYEQYDEIIEPRTVLSILGLQKQYQNYFHPSSLQDQTKCLSLCLKIKV